MNMSEPVVSWWAKPPVVVRYGVSIISVGFAVALGMFIEQRWHGMPYVSLFLCAVMCSAWFGGINPAFLAVALSTLAFDYFFLPPRLSLGADSGTLSQLVLFIISASLAGFLTAIQKSSAEKIRRARDDLAAKVMALNQTNHALGLENAERKRAEETARESQQLLHLVLATLPVAVAVTDRSGDIVIANAASKRIWGETIVSGHERWAGSKGFWHDSGRAIAPEEWASVRALRQGQTSLNELVDIETFDGRRKTILNSSVPIRNSAGAIVGAVIVNEDTTERMRAEAAHQLSEQRFRHLFAHAPIAIWEEDFSLVGDWLAGLRAQGIVDLDDYLESEPLALAKALELVRSGDTNDTAFRLFEVETKEELKSWWSGLMKGEASRVFAGELQAIWLNHHQAEFECAARTARGRNIHCLVHWVAAVEAGKINYQRVIVAVADITELKKSQDQLRQIEADMARAARLIIMGELTAAIAHEVNQPLAAVVMNADAATRWLAQDPVELEEARAAILRVSRDGNRASEVIKHMRALIKKGEPARGLFNLNELIRETTALTQSELARNQVTLMLELDPKLPPVPADRVQLQQVLLNLITNALDAMSTVSDHPRVLQIRTGTADAKTVRVAVMDTGRGIDPGESEHVFNSFYTTKPHGLGLGLAICRSIIEAHGGQLRAKPGHGPGAVFEFDLPFRYGGSL